MTENVPLWSPEKDLCLRKFEHKYRRRLLSADGSRFLGYFLCTKCEKTAERCCFCGPYKDPRQ